MVSAQHVQDIMQVLNRETTWDVPLSHPMTTQILGVDKLSLVYEHHERNYVLQLCTSDKLFVMEVKLTIKILLLTFILSSAATRGNGLFALLLF